MPALIDFFRERDIAALGIASFGPLCLDRGDPMWGSITSTPKLPWRNFDLTGTLARALQKPVGLDTDVNAAALAEARLGAARGEGSCVYFTVGTGIGGGVYLDGKPVHGLVHPEFGHILLRAHPDDPAPDGFCPYHVGCLEGLANGPAIQKRWGRPGHELPPEHPAWPLEAHYLAQACMAALLILSPRRIVLGGGVMHQAHLFPMIRAEMLRLLGGYVQHRRVLEQTDELIVPPGLGDNAGGVGALLLGLEALSGR
jgi:fructokinase